MPGYADWRSLYHDERRTLWEEGYQVDSPKGDILNDASLPLPAGDRAKAKLDDLTETQWEEAYQRLWATREKGLRADYPYMEPDDYGAIIAEAEPVPALTPLDDAEYARRIRGAWHGRLSACILGKPLEMGWDHKMVRKYLESVDAYPLADYVPERSEKLNITLRSDCRPSTRGNVQYAQPDDDIHYTVMSLLLAERKGKDFTRLDVGRDMLQHTPIFWYWGCDHQIYWHLVKNKAKADWNFHEDPMPGLDGFRWTLNPWREWICGQLKADLWGYVSPANPRGGAPLIHRMAGLSMTKNGIYGGMFVSGAISAALSKDPTVEKIIAGGLSCIPKRSRLAEAVRNVVCWAKQYPDWRDTADRLYERYGHLHFADQVNNLALCTLAICYGGLDWEKSSMIAVMAGTDTDCNGATVGSIIGAAVGFDAIPHRWYAPLKDTVKTVVGGFGQGSITELVERTIACRSRLAIA